MKHLMIDLETLSTDVSSAIISIGACTFDVNGIIDTRYDVVDLNQPYRDVNIDTIKWWMQQSEEARQVFKQPPTHTLEGSLKALAEFYPPGAKVWSHGASFDIPIIEHAMKQLTIPVPWSHRDIRDTRTAFDLKGVEIEKTGTVHNALDDALNQARAVIKALNKD